MFLNSGNLIFVFTLMQTFDQPKQRPDVARMLRIALQLPNEAQVGAIHIFRFDKAPLFGQKRSKRVAWALMST